MTLRLTLVAVTACATALAQAPDVARIRTPGKATQASGAKWAGARVTFSSVMPDPRLGAPDVVEAVVGDNGRFEVMLRADRAYSAWAEQGDGHAIRFSSVVRELLCGERVHLVEREEPPARPEIVVSGLEAWGPGVRITVVDRLARRTKLTLDSKQRAKLPIVPGDACDVEFSRPRGGRFFSHTVWLTRAARRRAQRMRRLQGDPDKPPTVERIEIAPPVQLRIRILDESNAPIVGAAVSVMIGSWLGPSVLRATSNARGLARVTVPRWLFRGWSVSIRAKAPGFALRGHVETLPHDDDRPPELQSEPAVRDVTMKLAKGFQCKGLVTDDKTPAGRVRLVYALSSKGAGVARPGITETDDRGRWSIAGLSRESGWLDVALVLPKQGGQAAAEPMPEFRLSRMRGGGYRQLGGDIELPPVDLASLRTFECQLLLPDGSPAAHAFVDELGPITDGSLADKHEPGSPLWDTIRCDKRGRFRVRTTQSKVALAIHTGEHYLHSEVDLTKAKTPLVLTLSPFAIVEGTVVSADGKPLEGMSVHSAGYRWPDIKGRRFEQFHGFNHGGDWLQDMTDAKGRFRLRFIPKPKLTIGIVASKRIGGRTVFSGVREVSESTSDVRLFLDLGDK